MGAEAVTLRGWFAFAALGSAGVLGWRGDWLAAVVAAGFALRPVAAWVRGELAATQAMLRQEHVRRVPRPAIGCLREPGPPWQAAPVPVTAEPCRRDRPRKVRHPWLVT